MTLRKISALNNVSVNDIATYANLEIIRRPGALGDALMAAHFVHILNQNGVAAVYEGQAKHLLACPMADSVVDASTVLDWVFDYSWIPDYRLSILDCSLDKFTHDYYSILGQKQFAIDKSGVPIQYQDLPEVEGVDVAIASKSGSWSPIRNYPYFQRLKDLFDMASISYLDLTDRGVVDFECLNVVRKSKLYLGLETGVSHLVSSFCTEKNSLILQSGYSTLTFWAKHYAFDHMALEPACAPCFLRQIQDCKHDHCCMARISPELVFEKVRSKLLLLNR